MSTSDTTDASTFKVCETIHVEKADELFAMLNRSHKMWDGPESTEWVFRGQSDADWRLVPSIHRDSTLAKLKPILDKFAIREVGFVFDFVRSCARCPGSTIQDKPANFVLQEVVDETEFEIVRRFADLADELGLPIEDRRGWRDHDTTDSRLPTTTLALAQHHGVPTCLLDWTYNPRVAAAFAVEPMDFSRPIAIWALRADFACPAWELDYPAPSAVRRYRPIRRTNAFLHAQDGLFTWHAWDSVFATLQRSGEFPSLDDVLAADMHRRWSGRPPLAESPMRKIVLAAEAVPVLREMLWKERVSRPHLMPTFDNVARALLDRWRG